MSIPILIVEDDLELACVLRQGFEQENLSVQLAHDGGEGFRFAQWNKLQAIVLDVTLPTVDGFTVAGDLRSIGNRTPILMLTARDSVTDIVRGLDAGVDDYVTKPFSFLELSARVRALIRRAGPPITRLEAGDLVLNSSTHEVLRDGVAIHLSRTEFQMLELLLRNKGHVVRRRDLLREIWGEGISVEDNTLDASMSALRARVECAGRPRVIHTVRGFGYRVDEG